jgi:hypothetical protein
MDVWFVRGATREGAPPADWHWMHRTDHGEDVSPEGFDTLEDCIADARRHGFERDDAASGFSWTSERDHIVGLYRPRAARVSGEA